MTICYDLPPSLYSVDQLQNIVYLCTTNMCDCRLPISNKENPQPNLRQGQSDPEISPYFPVARLSGWAPNAASAPPILRPRRLHLARTCLRDPLAGWALARSLWRVDPRLSPRLVGMVDPVDLATACGSDFPNAAVPVCTIVFSQ